MKVGDLVYYVPAEFTDAPGGSPAYKKAEALLAWYAVSSIQPAGKVFIKRRFAERSFKVDAKELLTVEDFDDPAPSQVEEREKFWLRWYTG